MKLELTIDGKRYEVDVEVKDDHDPRALGGYLPPLPPLVRANAPGPMPIGTPVRGNGQGNVAEDKVCRSPMAGVVVKVNVQVGQAIELNDLLFVLEAMKMETNITAPVAGKVKSVDVQPGDGVQLNQVLVEFE